MIAILRKLVIVAVTAVITVGGGYLAGQPTPAPKPTTTTVVEHRQVYDHPAEFVVMHHQGGAAFPDRAAALRWFLSIGDSDIAYNALITPTGAVWNGRDEKYQSAANLGINRRAVAFCLLGNLDEHPATDAQLLAGGLWVRAALKRHPGARLIQHKDAARIAHDPSVATGCPGAYSAKLNTARAIFLIAGGMPVPAAKAKALAELR